MAGQASACRLRLRIPSLCRHHTPRRTKTGARVSCPTPPRFPGGADLHSTGCNQPIPDCAAKRFRVQFYSPALTRQNSTLIEDDCRRGAIPRSHPRARLDSNAHRSIEAGGHSDFGQGSILLQCGIQSRSKPDFPGIIRKIMEPAKSPPTHPASRGSLVTLRCPCESALVKRLLAPAAHELAQMWRIRSAGGDTNIKSAASGRPQKWRGMLFTRNAVPPHSFSAASRELHLKRTEHRALWLAAHGFCPVVYRINKPGEMLFRICLAFNPRP